MSSHRLFRYLFKILFNIISNKGIRTLVISALSIFIFTIVRDYLEIYRSPISFEAKDVRVIDGDTIVLNNINIRLLGIDAPEMKQQCNGPENSLVNCGVLAKKEMQKLIRNNPVKCSNKGLDRYRRVLAYCYVKDINLNVELVKAGYAYAYSGSNLIFQISELIAHISRKGLWKTNFQNPKDWRRQKSKMQKPRNSKRINN